jgi:hypothetical protein
VAHRQATNEFAAAVESEFAGIDYEQYSAEDLYRYLGAERAETLLAKLKEIEEQKIAPSLAAATDASEAIQTAEQQIQNILTGAQSPVEVGTYTGRVVTLLGVCTAGAAATTAGIFSSVVLTGLYCAVNTHSVYTECLRQNEGSQGSDLVGQAVIKVQCAADYLKSFPECAGSVAMMVGRFIASAATQGGSELVQVLVNLESADSNNRTAVTIMGKRNSTPRSKSHDAVEVIEIIPVDVSEPESTITSFISQSDNGVFQMPEGNWDITVFAEGRVRQSIENLEISRFDGDIGIQVPMVSPGDLENEQCDSQIVPDASDDPLEVTALTTPSDTRIDQPVGVSVSVKGGTPPYSYEWYAPDADIPAGNSLGSDGTATFIFSSTGVFPIEVTISDSLGSILTSATTVTVAQDGEAPTEPMWDNDCGYDNVMNTGGATAIWSMGDPVPYTGRGLICSDRNSDLWLNHNGVAGTWLLVDDIGRGGPHPTRTGCYSQPAVALNSGAVIGGDWICPL